jgi:GLPGLI family protein
MKKIVSLSLALSFFCCAIYAQTKLKEGSATFKIDYDLDAQTEQMRAMLPSDANIFFKGDKIVVETLGGFGEQRTITDSKKGESIMLMDMMGNKMAVKTTKADVDKELAKKGKPKVEITSETKTIAGYTCTKAIVTSSEGSPVDIWFAKDLAVNNSFNQGYEGINGMLLEYSVKNEMFNMKMFCTEIKAEKVDDAKFDIPSDYKMMSKDDLKKMRGGN